MIPRPLVFVGPSLAAIPAAFERRGPAAAGDLLRLAAAPPRTIVLIDGVFDTAAAVQHKEILELLWRGFRIIGGASMGALRAAELAPFGMEGVGTIFSAYSSGRITGDDEVAVLHAPAALGYRPLTAALVDVRATLAAAARQRIIPLATARALRRNAAAMFWRDREWPGLIATAEMCDGDAAKRFAAWLPAGHVSLKSRDAVACLVAARLPAAAVPLAAPPPRTRYFLALAAGCGVTLSP